MSDSSNPIHLVTPSSELSLHQTATRGVMKLRHKQVAIKGSSQKTENKAR